MKPAPIVAALVLITAPLNAESVPEDATIEILNSVADYTEPLRATELLDRNLRNARGEELGEVKDVVLNPDGTVRYLLVSVGGAAGLGDERIGVPWFALQISADGSTLFVPMSKSQVSAAPRLSDVPLEVGLSPDWSRRNEAYFRARLPSPAGPPSGASR